MRTTERLILCLGLATAGGATGADVFFSESFDDANLTKRDWYDGDVFRIAGESRAGAGCIEYEWTAADAKVSGSSGVRHLIEPTDEVCLRFYLNFSKGWGWSGREYHPHLLHFMTTENTKWHGPAASHLTVYIEPVNGKLRLAATDIQNEKAPHGLTQGPLKGGFNGKTYDSAEALFTDDKWHCIEACYKLNTLDLANDRPNPDGIVRGWFDGKLVVDHTDVILRSTDFPAMKFNQFLMTPYFGPGLLPHAQKLWIDELTVGTKRIESPSDSPAAGGDSSLTEWFQPQNWQRDSDTPALSLGEKGKFDDQHIFAPHVIQQDGEFWMYYCGSQRCVDAGTYKGTAKDPAHPEKSDQRLFKLGLAKSKDGIHFTRHSTEPVFSFGDDVHSVVTAAILKNPDGSVCREDGKLRMYFAAVDFPDGKYKHYLYQTTSTDGIAWAKPSLVTENAYAPCVIKDGSRYRMWYTWIDKHPWHTGYAESADGTKWTLHDKPCIVMDQAWEKKDQVYPAVMKAGDVFLMLYGCYWNDDKHTALGFAASRDGLTWTKHPDNPVFRPEPTHDWESNFTTSQCLMRLPDGSFRVWYAGRKQPPWGNLYFAIGTSRWKGPEK